MLTELYDVGTATVLRSDVGPYLPVFVLDRYEGIEARRLHELERADVQRFIDGSVRALRDLVRSRVVDGRQRIVTHVSFHAAGEQVLFPWAHTSRDLVGSMTGRDLRTFRVDRISGEIGVGHDEYDMPGRPFVNATSSATECAATLG